MNNPTNESESRPAGKGRPLARRLTMIVAVAFLLYSALGFLLVPTVVRSQVVKWVPVILGLEASVERVRFNPFTLGLTLSGLVVEDRAGDRFLATEELYVNAETSSLFRWAAVLDEVRIERPYVGLRRLENGELNFLEPAERGVEAAKGIEQIPRAIIGRFVMHGGVVDIEDRVPADPLQTRLGPVELTVNHISTLPDDAGDHAVSATFEGGAMLEWNGEFTVNPFAATGQLELDGLAIQALWRYVEHMFRFEVRDGRVSAALSYRAVLDSDGSSMVVENGSFNLDDLRVTPEGDETDVLSVSNAAVTGVTMRWPESVVDVEKLLVSGANLSTWLRENGTLNWLDFTEITLSETDRVTFAADDDPAPAKEAKAEPAPPWRIAVATVDITEVATRFEDRTVDPTSLVELDGVRVGVDGFDTTPDSTFDLDISFVTGRGGSASIEGSVGLIPSPVAELDVAVDGLGLAVAQPYVTRFADVDIRGGTLALAGRAGFKTDDAGPRARFDGRVDVDGLALHETGGPSLAGWTSLGIHGVKATGFPSNPAIEVREVLVTEPRASLKMDERGQVNVLRALRIEQPEIDSVDGEATPAAPVSKTTAPTTVELPFPIAVRSVRVERGSLDLENLTLPEPWSARLHALRVGLDNVKPGATSDLSLEGRMDETAILAAKGRLTLFEPGRLVTLDAEARGVSLTDLSPYAQKFAGYRIEAGTLATTLSLEVRDQQLNGRDHLKADGLVLGEKVKSPDSLDLPLEMAVGLLKDKHGTISLDVPLSGNLNDPGFDLGAVMAQATKKVLTNLVKSPFKLLGNLVGVKGENLAFVEFQAGQSVLLPPEREKLGKLVGALQERPKLVLKVSGSWSDQQDPPALAAATVELRIAEATGATGVSRSEALQALYVERFSAKSLDELRQVHLPRPSDTPGESASAAEDGPEFLDTLLEALVAAESIGPAELSRLAESRADAIIAALGEAGLTEGVRLRRSDVSATSQKTDKGSGAWVRCGLQLAPRG